ncbi:MAG: hypothetical protein P8M22_09970 [Phycisphaerales bacterium]|nr:hypothetical protein [Phycisphaerales bacterium]
MLQWIITGFGMVAVGWLVWTLLKAQGHATPPTDDPVDGDGTA